MYKLICTSANRSIGSTHITHTHTSMLTLCLDVNAFLTTANQADKCCAPLVVKPLTNMTRLAGSIVKWNCEGDDDTSQFSWYKDGAPLNVPDYGSIVRGYRSEMYTISNAQRRDSGWYTCQISNNYTSVNTSAYFLVIGRCYCLFLPAFTNYTDKLYAATPLCNASSSVEIIFCGSCI